MNLPKEFLAHGVVTCVASYLYCENNMQSFETHMLVMEVNLCAHSNKSYNNLKSSNNNSYLQFC